jgi:hypothetical protein
LLGFYFPLKCENQKTHNVYSEFLLLFMWVIFNSYDGFVSIFTT